MKIKFFLLVAFFTLVSFAPNLSKTSTIRTPSTYSKTNKIEFLYHSLDANNFQLPKLESFSKALEGFYFLKEKGLIQKEFLTIIDFSLSSKAKRLWVIDLFQNKIIFNSLVAHGKNSGDDYATSFSNQNKSNKSCLGFFATAECYVGLHGLSLKLDGLEKGINDNARQRSIVIHGADYVCSNFIKDHNRLGRSQGCPALPVEMSAKIIEKIKDKSCLFIYHPSRNNSFSS
ncbi:MAG: murein L,D-transpeptidase catalytic domain family protein [Flavobacterium sp.]|nr:murein L,D-transpeptidase catalytic domain family protein [Flavobacterium sp.]